MLHRLTAYARRHHIAFLALFVALGGGAYAAGSLGTADSVGFGVSVTNSSGTKTGTLAKLHGLSLRLTSLRPEDTRRCAISARAGGKGQVSSFTVTQPSEGPSTQAVRSKTLSKGKSGLVARTSFNPGAPGVTSELEGQLTWQGDSPHDVVTGVFHVHADSGACRFAGTLTGAG